MSLTPLDSAEWLSLGTMDLIEANQSARKRILSQVDVKPDAYFVPVNLCWLDYHSPAINDGRYVNF